MGKDFRIGLVVGSILAVATLAWVATRPSLRPRARTAPPGTVTSGGVMPWEEAGSAAEPDRREPASPGSVPAAGGPTNPQTAIHNPHSVQPAGPDSGAANAYRPQPATSALPDLTVYERDEKIETTRFHIVRRGDTLSAISRQYYGTPNSWQKILAANQEIIKDPDKIAPGTKLIIPE